MFLNIGLSCMQETFSKIEKLETLELKFDYPKKQRKNQFELLQFEMIVKAANQLKYLKEFKISF